MHDGYTLKPALTSSKWSVQSPVSITQDVVSALPSATLYAQMLHLHGTASSLGAAPRHFLAFADLYGRILVNKKNQLNEQQQFLKVCKSMVAVRVWCTKPDCIFLCY